MNINEILKTVSIIIFCCALSSCKSTSAPENREVVYKNSYSWKRVSALDDSPFNTMFYNASTKRIFQVLERRHYVVTDFNDAFSERVFNQLIKLIDPTNEYLTKSNVDDLTNFKYLFDDMFKTGDLTKAYDVMDIMYKHRDKSLENAELFTINETILYGSKSTFNRVIVSDRTLNEDALNAYWIEKVKYDALNLHALGMKTENIGKMLRTRYQNIRKVTIAQKYSILMRAYTTSVDPHSTYFDPTYSSDMKHSIETVEQYGVGLNLRNELGKLIITDVHPLSTRNQINFGDELVAAINNSGEYIDLQQQTAQKAVDLLKGELGTTLSLKVVRQKITGLEILTFKLERKNFPLIASHIKETVYSKFNPISKLGVIKIPSFYSGVSEDVKTELQNLIDQNVIGVLIDLRNNGGGALTEANKLTGLFIEQGPVFQIRDGNNTVRTSRVKDTKIYYNGPLTILVNSTSAGASEIFTAAMKDYGRALVVGEKTFGYGTVQKHIKLNRDFDLFDSSMGSIQYTMAKFYRINGNSTQLNGVTPDIYLFGKNHRHIKREEDYDYALAWDSVRSTQYNQLDFISKVAPEIKLLREKYLQLTKYKNLDSRELGITAENISERYSLAINKII